MEIDYSELNFRQSASRTRTRRHLSRINSRVGATRLQVTLSENEDLDAEQRCLNSCEVSDDEQPSPGPQRPDVRTEYLEGET